MIVTDVVHVQAFISARPHSDSFPAAANVLESIKVVLSHGFSLGLWGQAATIHPGQTQP